MGKRIHKILLIFLLAKVLLNIEKVGSYRCAKKKKKNPPRIKKITYKSTALGNNHN